MACVSPNAAPPCSAVAERHSTMSSAHGSIGAADAVGAAALVSAAAVARERHRAQLQLHVVPALCHLYREVARVYPGAAERTGYAADARPTAALYYLRPGILRMEDVLMGSYEGRQWPPLDPSLLGKAL